MCKILDPYQIGCASVSSFLTRVTFGTGPLKHKSFSFGGSLTSSLLVCALVYVRNHCLGLLATLFRSLTHFEVWFFFSAFSAKWGSLFALGADIRLAQHRWLKRFFSPSLNCQKRSFDCKHGFVDSQLCISLASYCRYHAASTKGPCFVGSSECVTRKLLFGLLRVPCTSVWLLGFACRFLHIRAGIVFNLRISLENTAILIKPLPKHGISFSRI